jgi:trk system potassium uptake protein TrkH
MISTILIAITDPEIDFLQLCFEVVSAFATVGLSTGVTADISPLGQLILVCTMYTGRVGILVLMAAILGDAKPSRVQYPEQNLLVG